MFMSSPVKIALVTGAGSGIGRAVSHALLKEGYVVVLTGRRLESLKQTLAQADAPPEQVLAIPSDIREAASVESLFEQIGRTYGRLDLLFNNAGINAPAVPLEDLAMADWEAVVATNLTGAFLCTQQAFRIMKSQQPKGGRIINNGSVSAQAPRPHSIAYTATKHAVTGLTKSTSLDGRAHHIACGQIDIGNAGTDMTEKMTLGVPQADGSIRPEPTMDVQQVARAVVYMASLPLDANVPFMTVMATRMPLVGRG
jgi:NAD(P)-dependent dehydrogenase (short-subunit alcohol dehydrogenase family)